MLVAQLSLKVQDAEAYTGAERATCRPSFRPASRARARSRKSRAKPPAATTTQPKGRPSTLGRSFCRVIWVVATPPAGSATSVCPY
jgi:hypothetical protein